MQQLLSGILSLVMLLIVTICQGANKPALASPLGPNPVAQPAYPQGIAFQDHEAQQKQRKNNPVQESTLQAINQFSYHTGAKILSHIQTNGCYSPLSLYFALSLAATGAQGNTRDEFLKVLGISNTPALSQQCRNLYGLLYTDNAVSKLKIANSLWLDEEVKGQNIPFQSTFLQNATTNFYASLYKADFADPNTGKAMGQWVAANTNNTLAPTMTVDPEQIMALLNTIYYQDQWLNRFDSQGTKIDVFYLENGSTILCHFMNKTDSSQGFTKGQGYTRSSLPLKNSGQMVLILPDKGISVNQLVSSPDKLAELFTPKEDTIGQVVWQIPKFCTDTNLSLLPTLQALGISAAFQEDADFSGITKGQAFISAITQTTHISIDEKGVEASAFTNLSLGGSSKPKGRVAMILNRPFIYGLITSQGTPLFMGICGNPAS